jgi:hypothetical protein
MSEESKKIEKTEQEEKASEVSDQDLENAAGGGVMTASTVCCPAPTAPPATKDPKSGLTSQKVSNCPLSTL